MMLSGTSILEHVGRAATLVRHDRAAARALLEPLWAQAASPLERCAIAHTLADAQDAPADELAWDERALAAATELTDDDVVTAGIAISVRGFYASLHLNLADVQRRLGNTAAAWHHVTAGRAALAALAADGYRAMIAAALQRVADELTPL